MSQLKVTQLKSGIGAKPNQRQTLRSLGLKRINDSVVQQDRPEIRGMVATIPHLVRLEEIEGTEIEGTEAAPKAPAPKTSTEKPSTSKTSTVKSSASKSSATAE